MTAPNAASFQQQAAQLVLISGGRASFKQQDAQDASPSAVQDASPSAVYYSALWKCVERLDAEGMLPSELIARNVAERYVIALLGTCQDAADGPDKCVGLPKAERFPGRVSNGSDSARRFRVSDLSTVPTESDSVLTPVPPSRPSDAAAGGGLASRRKVQPVNMETRRPSMKGAAMKPQVAKEVKIERKEIRTGVCFLDFYELGSEVMPSANRGMSVNFAKRKSDAADVVVKIRQKDVSFRKKEDEQEWRRSTELLLNLPQSENIAQIYEVMEDKDAYYIVMERVNGLDLYEFIHADRRTFDEARAILRQLLVGIGELHARGCIHKDIKLENVMITSPVATPPRVQSPDVTIGSDVRCSNKSIISMCSDSVKLIDFDTVEAFAPKTIAKSVVGTDQYIAQEAYAGRYSPASDIFALGVVAYILICGRFPFQEAMFDDRPGENWVGSPKMKSIQDRLKQSRIDFDIDPWPSQPNARDLTRWMLQHEGKDRPTAQQALDHIFFEYTGQTPDVPKSPWVTLTELSLDDLKTPT